MKSCVCGVSGAGSPIDPAMALGRALCRVHINFRRLIVLRRHMPAEVRLASIFAFAVCALSFGGSP